MLRIARIERDRRMQVAALVVGGAIVAVLIRAIARGYQQHAEAEARDPSIGSRKPGQAPRPDSEDPLERIESQVVARERG
jgi:hypothetical protein